MIKHLYLFLILWIGAVSAESVTITEPVSMEFNNGAYITLIPNQTMINMTVFNDTDPIYPTTFQINLLGSQVWAATDANITLSNLKYSIPQDNLSYNIDGNVNFNMTAKMGSALLEYQILRDAINDGTVISRSNKVVTVLRTTAIGIVNFIIRPFITTAPGETRIITFTDATCLGGILCESKIHIYSGSTQLGEITSTGSYLAIDKNVSTINITLDESTLGQTNNADMTRSIISNNWQVGFGLMLIFGIIVTLYFIIKNTYNKRR